MSDGIEATGERPVAAGRRAEDIAASSVLAQLSTFFEKSGRVIAGVVAILGVVAACTSYIGARLGTPKRVDALEVRMTSEGVTRDTAIAAVRRDVSDLRAAYDADRQLWGEQLELLLRIACPTQQRPDLFRPCRTYNQPSQPPRR